MEKYIPKDEKEELTIKLNKIAVIVNEIEFEKLMDWLKENTNFVWDNTCKKPTEYNPFRAHNKQWDGEEFNKIIIFFDYGEISWDLEIPREGIEEYYVMSFNEFSETYMKN